MTKDDKYKLTASGTKLVKVLVNPDSLGKCVTECAISLT